LSLFFLTYVSAQQMQQFGYVYNPSAESYNLSHFGNAGPDLHTGAMSYSLPVYTYSDPDFTLPISLDYHYQGYRPSAHSGLVGLGWSLNAGGIITREVRGFPDEMLNGYSQGYWWYTTASITDTTRVGVYSSKYAETRFWLTQLTDFSNLFDVYSDIPVMVADSAGFYESYGSQYMYDAEPDIFHFSFGGISGDFVLCRGREPIVFNANVPPGELSVAFNGVPRWGDQAYAEIVITTGDGYKYTFGGTRSACEYCWSRNEDWAPLGKCTATAWKLVSISTPENGRRVTFTYDSSSAQRYITFEPTYTPDVHFTGIQIWHHGTQSEERSYNNSALSRKKVAYLASYRYPLSRIDISGGSSIEFQYQDRTFQECAQTNFESTFTENISRYESWVDPITTEKRLSGIVVKRSSGAEVRSVTLAQEFRSSAPYKMFLTEVENSADGTQRFSYNEPNCASLPKNDRGGRDFWGFWNGKTECDFRSCIDPGYFGSLDLVLQYAGSFHMKDPSPEHSSKCALSRIDYPSGGYSEIIYEGNRANRVIDRSASLFPYLETTVENAAVGGIRVKKVRHCSPQDGFADSTRFVYSTPAYPAWDSGTVMNYPRMGMISEYGYAYAYQTSSEGSMYGELHVTGTAYADPLNTGPCRDAFLTYSNVAEICSDGSRKEYDFTDWNDYPDSFTPVEYTASILKNMYTCEDIIKSSDWDLNFKDEYEYALNPPSIDRSGFRGKVREIREYDADSILVKRTVNRYKSLYLGNMRQYSNALDHFVKTRRHYTHPLLCSTVETVFEDGDSLSVRDSIEYNPLGQISHRETSTPGRTLGYGTYYTYCHEGSGSGRCESRGALLSVRKTAVRDSSEYVTLLHGYSYDPSRKRIAPVAISDSLTQRNSTFQYDTFGHCISACLNGTRQYTYTWDAPGTHIIRTSGPDTSAVRSFTWLDQAGPSSITDWSGKTKYYTYDTSSRLASVLDGSLRTVQSYTYKTDTTSVAPSAGCPVESTPLSGASGVAVNMYTSDSGESFRDITYCNGLGYPLQTLATHAGGNGSSLITPIVYDTHRRPDARKYLPYPKMLSDASLITEPIPELNEWYCWEYGYSEMYNFEQTDFESHPSGRPVSARKPGKVFFQEDRKAYTSYSLNHHADSVLTLKYLPASGDEGEPSFTVAGWTPDCTLRKTAFTDEDGRTTESYSDAFGRVVMTRGRPDGRTRCDTYYIRDVRDSIVCIIQPEGAAAIAIGDTMSFTSPFAMKWTFRRKYDIFGNLVASAAPGTGLKSWTDEYSEYYSNYIYDTRDRLTSYASPRMKWLGIEQHTVYNERDQVVQQYYTQQNTTIPSIEMTYYPSAIPHDLRFVAEEGFAEEDDLDTVHVKTLPAVEVQHCVPLMKSDMEASPEFSRRRAFHYDSKGRVIQIVESDSDGFFARYSTRYDFLGNVVATKEEHHDQYGVSFFLSTFYQRDRRGRVLSVAREVDEMPLDTLFYEYDDLGRLSYTYVQDDKFQKYSHWTLQGWDEGSESTAWNTDLLLEYIFYWNPFFLHPQYSGQIAGTDVLDSEGFEKVSHYSYDGLGRLVDAETEIYGDMINLDTERDIKYDRNGNILSLKRYVGENYSAPAFSRDGNHLASNMYDFNGNCTYDYRSGLSFSNNVLNLPGVIENDMDEYWTTYLPDGTKTSLGSWTGVSDRYCGSFVFHRPQFNTDYDLSSIAWDEGRVFFEKNSDGTLTRKDALMVRDHLGNVRSILNLSVPAGTEASVKELEKADYLPYGTAGTGGSYSTPKTYAPNRWRFEGKEDLPGGLSDSGARYYAPSSGSWLQSDPEAFSYPSLSPYSFCAGNPVRFVDPEGRKIVIEGDEDYSSRVYLNLQYLKENDLDFYISQLESSDFIYTFKKSFNHNGEEKTNCFCRTEQIIYFDPYKIYFLENRYVSPAVILNHELHHASIFDRLMKRGTSLANEYYNQFMTIFIPKYGNIEDELIISTSEYHTALKLGEITPDFGPRKSHSVPARTYSVSSMPKDISNMVYSLNNPSFYAECNSD